MIDNLLNFLNSGSHNSFSSVVYIMLWMIFWFVASFVFRMIFANNGAEAKNVVKILNSNIKGNFYERIIEGQYRGYRIICSYYCSGSRKLRIIPNKIVLKKNLDGIIDVLKPTGLTMLLNGIVYMDLYIWDPFKYYDLVFSKLSESKLIMIFDEMVRAAEIVDNKTPCYKGSWEGYIDQGKTDALDIQGIKQLEGQGNLKIVIIITMAIAVILIISRLVSFFLNIGIMGKS